MAKKKNKTKKSSKDKPQVEKSKPKNDFWEKNKTNLIGWGLIAVVIVAFIAIVSFTNQRVEDNISVVMELREEDNIKGDEDGETVLVKFSDFRCPACASFSALGNQLVADEIPGGVQYVYRHFPILGEQSTLAAIASEAAGEQGQFWEYHDLLMAQQPNWNGILDQDELTEQLVEFAEDLDLDVEQFSTDLESQELADKVAADRELADSINASGTPTVIINGETLNTNGLSGYEELREFIIENLPEGVETDSSEEELGEEESAPEEN